MIAEESGELDVDANTSPTYYELVDKRFKPDGDEYYLDGVFSSRGIALPEYPELKARAGELHQFGATYKVGDYINEGLLIKAINTRRLFIYLMNLKSVTIS